MFILNLIVIFCIAGTEEFCANKWPDDYRMRNYCQEQQAEAKQQLFLIADSKGLIKNSRLSVSPNGNEYERIIYQCIKRWRVSRFGTYDYRMLVYCIEKQIEAYVKIKQKRRYK